MRIALLTILLFATAPALAQERLVGRSIDVRTTLNFKISAPIQKILPAGWTPNPSASGPSATANMKVTFIDQLAGYDAAGKKTAPIQYVTFSVPVKRQDNESGVFMIVAGLSPGGPGPYGTNVKSANTVERRIRRKANETIVDESWECAGDDGFAVSMQIQYLARNAVRHKAEIRNYSQRKPEFFRIYRYEELEDAISGIDVETGHLRSFSFRARGGALSELFDGTEQLISVTAAPWYAREIYLPAL